MIKGVIFDMDGTIVDSLPYHHEAWRIFFEENKVEDFSEKLKKYKGGGTLDLMKAVYGNIYTVDELKKMSDDKEIIFRKIYKGNIKPIKGFLEFIFELKSKDIIIGLASNAIRKNVTLTLNELGVYDLFDNIICGDEVSFGKPNPEMFDKTVIGFNLKKDDCIIFEDSIEGVGGAVNAGINVIGVTSSNSSDILNKAGCIASINNFIDIDQLLR
ncbi:MAG: HAD family phosphatase [Flavobacteriaceae bacterium]|nr:HAD family phosphatase [Flavobacteriaceae bacterium]MBL6679052.1 HAD family phosphatase [Flavobacteriaceae bacterium]